LKTAGILGGIGPESTIEYYRFIIDAYRNRTGNASYPSIIINSINMTRMLGSIATGRLDETAEYLLHEMNRIVAAGADFAVLASNTPHIVFDKLRQHTRIPLISIVEAACRAASAAGLHKIGLFGTRFTMQGGFYQTIFNKAGIELVVPSAEEQEYMHEKYMNELVKGILLNETRARMVQIAAAMKKEHEIQALILGGTELPLILRDTQEIGIPMLDTTKIHVTEIVDAILEEA
jgi:aspartate racemase